MGIKSERTRWIRFADEMGKDLFQCKTLPDSPYGTPVFGSPLTRALNRVNGLPSVPSNNRISDMTSDYRPTFTISDRADSDVKLESASITKSDLLEFRGSARVKPLSPSKSVWVRFTTDHWDTYEDRKAYCLPKRRADGRETFAFLVGLPPSITEPVEFCIFCQFKMDSRLLELWDNNNGFNYSFVKNQPLKPTVVLASSNTRGENVWRTNSVNISNCSNFTPF